MLQDQDAVFSVVDGYSTNASSFFENFGQLAVKIVLFLVYYWAGTFLVIAVQKQTESLADDRSFGKDNLLDAFLSDAKDYSTPGFKQNIARDATKNPPTQVHFDMHGNPISLAPLHQMSEKKLVGWSFSLSLADFLHFVVASYIGQFCSLVLLREMKSLIEGGPESKFMAVSFSYLYNFLLSSILFFCFNLGINGAEKNFSLFYFSLFSYICIFALQLFPLPFSLSSLAGLCSLPLFLIQTVFFIAPFFPFLLFVSSKQTTLFIDRILSVFVNLGLYKILAIGSYKVAGIVENHFSYLKFPVFSTVCDDLGSYVFPAFNWHSSVGHYFSINLLGLKEMQRVHPLKKFIISFLIFIPILILVAV